MSKKGIWEQVRDIVNAGMCPEITLRPEDQVTRVKLPVGRPINPPDMTNYRHYKSEPQPGHRPICKARGCKRYLRLNQALWCSDDCQEIGISELSGVLSKLNEKEVEELLRLNLDLNYRVINIETETIVRKKKRRRKPPRYKIHKFTG